MTTVHAMTATQLTVDGPSRGGMIGVEDVAHLRTSSHLPPVQQKQWASACQH